MTATTEAEKQANAWLVARAALLPDNAGAQREP